MRLPRTMIRPRSGLLIRLMVFSLMALFISGCSGCVEESEETSDFFNPREYGDWEYGGKPDIDGPERAVFGDVLEGETVTQTLTVSNLGQNLLKLGQWEIEGPFELSFPAHDGRPPAELRPGEVIELTITYTARNIDPAEGQIRVESNDPDEQFFVIELFANADFPCLEIEPADKIDFGLSDLSMTHQRVIIATSCAERSTTTFQVTDISGASEFSLLDDAFRSEFELEPGESARINIGFTPQTPGLYEGAVYITSNDEFEADRVVELEGRGRPYTCPEPVIRAYNPDRGEAIADPEGDLHAVPLDTINLDASLSRDPEGTGIARVEWQIVERPPDSNTGLQNNDQTRSSVWMQLAGTYVVELHVWNEIGVKSCEPARMTLQAVADEDIHVQLVWSTPSDPNETDGVGSDVDLHLLHPNSNENWNLPPWDCFWQNQSPDWGTRGVSTDDPSLDIDDIDGAGPENINLDNPETDTTYSVGAYYFSDDNFGRSYVTVRIYIGGVLAHEAAREPMDDQEFWHVADVDWPGGGIIPVDRQYASFP